MNPVYVIKSIYFSQEDGAIWVHGFVELGEEKLTEDFALMFYVVHFSGAEMIVHEIKQQAKEKIRKIIDAKKIIHEVNLYGRKIPLN